MSTRTQGNTQKLKKKGTEGKVAIGYNLERAIMIDSTYGHRQQPCAQRLCRQSHP